MGVPALWMSRALLPQPRCHSTSRFPAQREPSTPLEIHTETQECLCFLPFRRTWAVYSAVNLIFECFNRKPQCLRLVLFPFPECQPFIHRLQVEKLCCQRPCLGSWAVLIKHSEPAVAFFFPFFPSCRGRWSVCCSSSLSPSSPVAALPVFFVPNGTRRLC